MAHLVLSGVPSPSLDLDSEGESWLRLNKKEASTGCVELLAVAEVRVTHMMITTEYSRLVTLVYPHCQSLSL